VGARHTNGVVFLEQALRTEVAKNAALDDALVGEEGLEVMLDDSVKGARRRMPRPVDGLRTSSARMPGRGGRAPREPLGRDRRGGPCRDPQGATMGG